LTDFPAYLNVSNETEMRNDYVDLRFISGVCDSNGGVELDYEIENYTSSKADIWVRIPSLSVGTTSICMYYNNSDAESGENAAGVWDDNTLLVQHLQEIDIDGGSGDIKDSTSYGNNGTSYGIDGSDRVDGKVDGSFSFNNIADATERVEIPDTLFQSNINSATLEYWVYITAHHSTYSCHIHRSDIDSIGSTVWWAGVSTPNNYLTVTFGASDGAWSDGESDQSLDAGQWYHVAGTWNGTHGKVFLNGTEIHSYEKSTVTNKACTFTIGRNNAGPGTYDYLFNGVIDNFYFSNTSRSEYWINQSYQMVENQNSFVIFEEEEEYDSSRNLGNLTSKSINTTQGITEITNITWTEYNTDDENNITVQLSVDNGQNWYSATNKQGLTGFIEDNSLFVPHFIFISNK
jgi:hypothetical protein